MNFSLVSPPSSEREGFTLIELLVVIAIIAILASLLLPALATAKAKGQSTVCMSNNKQLQLCWSMYSEDNSDRIVPNAISSVNAWIDGSGASAAYDLPGATNVGIVKRGLLYKYNGNQKIYVCPGQKDIYSISKSASLPLLPARSCSISGQMNGGTDGGPGKEVVPIILGSNPASAPANHRISDIKRPEPSNAFVFIDESKYTIDDGYFAVLVNEDTWQNYPSARHNRSTGLSFADGHAEVKRWIESSTLALKIPSGFSPAPKSGSARNHDLEWLSERYIYPPKP